MKKLSKIVVVGLTVLAFAGLSFNAVADSHEAPGNMAETWIVNIKPDMAAEFEAAFKNHMAVRTAAAEDRDWNVYSPAVGSDLGFYAIRTCCNHWADFDGYDVWEMENPGVGADWDANVDQFVASYEHYFTNLDFENSNWPEDGAEFPLIGVTYWYVKPGAAGAMNAAKAKMSQLAKEHGWPRNWSWGSGVGGSPSISLASPFENWAGMQAPEQNFADFLTEHMGSQEAALELLSTFSTSASSSTYTVYRHRPDLTATDSED